MPASQCVPTVQASQYVTPPSSSSVTEAGPTPEISVATEVSHASKDAACAWQCVCVCDRVCV